jgi:hypothetical protein
MDGNLEVIDAAVIILLALALAFGARWLFRVGRTKSLEPIIELEKLIHCRSCGSMIPQGARKCAFCGAAQRELIKP